jgi:trigger factor
MKSQVSEISPVLVEVKVEVPWETVKEDLDKTFQVVGREARVKGFRPGKVPPAIVRKLFGPRVNADVAANLVSRGLIAAVEEHSLQLCGEPDYGDIGELTKGETFSFAAKLEVRPTIDKVEFDKLEVYKEDAAVTDAEVEEEIERRRKWAIEYSAPEPMRPAQNDDRLGVSYAVTVDGEAEAAFSNDDNEIVLGSEGLLKEFQDGLLGKQPGDETTLEIAYPEEHTNEKLRGKTAVFAVKVLRVEAPHLPELNDEWAKEHDFDTMAELRAGMRKQLEESRTKKARNETRDQLIEALVARNAIEVPPSMVKQQEQAMVYEFAQFLQYAGGMGQNGLPENFFDDLKERAAKRVRGGLLLSAIARLENIAVDKADVDAKFTEIAETTGKHVAKVRADYQGDKLDELENEILNDKLLSLLESKAKVKKGKRPEPEKSAASAESEPA